MENRKSSLSVVTGHFEERYEDPIDFNGHDINKMTESQQSGSGIVKVMDRYKPDNLVSEQDPQLAQSRAQKFAAKTNSIQNQRQLGTSNQNKRNAINSSVPIAKSVDAAENGGARILRSESVDKMEQINTKLKGELIVLIGTMEQQLRKVQDRRAQRIKAERVRREDNQDNIRKAKLDVGKI